MTKGGHTKTSEILNGDSGEEKTRFRRGPKKQKGEIEGGELQKKKSPNWALKGDPMFFEPPNERSVRGGWMKGIFPLFLVVFPSGAAAGRGGRSAVAGPRKNTKKQ